MIVSKLVGTWECGVSFFRSPFVWGVTFQLGWYRITFWLKQRKYRRKPE